MLRCHDSEKLDSGPDPSPDLVEAERFIAALTGSPSAEVTYQTWIEPRDAPSSHTPGHFHGTVRECWPQIEERNLDGHGIGIVINETDLGGRRADNVVGLSALWVDDDSGTLTTDAINLSPSITVQSKAGPHYYWKLKPGEPLESFTPAQKILADVYRTDPSVSDLPHVMRLPGTLHLKDRKHPFLVETVQVGPWVYSISEILEAHGRTLPTTTATPRNGATTSTPITVDLDQSITRGRAYLEKIPGSPEGGRNAVAFRAAAVLTHDLAVPVDHALPILEGWNQRNEPPLPPEELAQIALNASRYGQSPTGSKLTTPSEPPPQIVTVTQLPPILVPTRLTIGRIKAPPREEFVLGSFIPFGKSSVLYGPQSVGKSAWMAQLAFAFAAGAEQLWGLPLYPGGGPVLIYTAEDTLEDWERKGAAILKGCGINVEKALERLYVIDKTEGVARLSEVITVRNSTTSRRIAQPTEEADALVAAAKKINAKLVLNETASRLVEDEDNANMSALQSALGRGARLTGAAWLTTHHPTKAASKDNDASPESARGGGAFVNNSRNGLSLFPADTNEAKKWEDRFVVDDLVVLGHAKPTSSTRRQPSITLVRCDAEYGAVFQLPDAVNLSPEQQTRNAQRLEQERQQEWNRFRRLYAMVEELLQVGTVSPFRLEQRSRELRVPKNAVYPLVNSAIECGVLKVATRNARGTTLALGHDPRRAVDGSRVEADAP